MRLGYLIAMIRKMCYAVCFLKQIDQIYRITEVSIWFFLGEGGVYRQLNEQKKRQTWPKGRVNFRT
jgi:hypothetical protein